MNLDKPEQQVETDALNRAVRSMFPEGNLVLSNPYEWPDPPVDRTLDYQTGWWAALRMVAEVGEPALNEFEHSIIDKIADLAADFIHLTGGEGEEAVSDFAEILPHLHALQQTVMAQAAARAHPGRYRLLGQVGSWNETPEWGPDHPNYDEMGQ